MCTKLTTGQGLPRKLRKKMKSLEPSRGKSWQARGENPPFSFSPPGSIGCGMAMVVLFKLKKKSFQKSFFSSRLNCQFQPGKDFEAVIDWVAGLEPEHQGDYQQGEDEQAGEGKHSIGCFLRQQSSGTN